MSPVYDRRDGEDRVFQLPGKDTKTKQKTKTVKLEASWMTVVNVKTVSFKCYFQSFCCLSLSPCSYYKSQQYTVQKSIEQRKNHKSTFSYFTGKWKPSKQPTVKLISIWRENKFTENASLSNCPYRYAICIRQEEGFCCVEYMVCADQVWCQKYSRVFREKNTKTYMWQ